MTTEARATIEAFEKAQEAATEGPWEAHEYRGSQGHECVGVNGPRLMCASVHREQGFPDARFIAHARNSPIAKVARDLLAQVEALTTRVKELESK